MDFQKEDIIVKVSKERFSAVGISTILYAILFGVCLFRNASGVTIIIIAIATVGYLIYCSGRLKAMMPNLSDKQNIADGINYGKINYDIISRNIYPYLTGIILLGISTSCTADKEIIKVNYIFMCLLIIFVLIKIFCEDSGWRFKKYGKVIAQTFLAPLMFLETSLCDFIALRKINGKTKNGKVKYVVSGILISVPILIVVVMLLASADDIFGQLVFSIVGEISISGDLIGFLIFVVCVFIYFYGLMTKMSVGDIKENVTESRTREPIIGITFIGIITFVYLVFSFIQIMYLFASESMLPDGYTYSEFAREGFFQLLFVSVINLFLVLICLAIFRKDSVLNIVLTVMSGCTYIMIASSAIKIMMYIREYNLTYLRILVLLALLIIAVVMAGIIIFIYNDSFPLVNYSVLTVMIIYIIFSFSKPEYIIAKYNIDNQSYEGEVGNDLYYLFELGADAAPALYDFVEEVYDSPDVSLSHDIKYHFDVYFNEIKDSKSNYSAIRGFNFSRYNAYKSLEKYERLTKYN